MPPTFPTANRMGDNILRAVLRGVRRRPCDVVTVMRLGGQVAVFREWSAE